MSRGPLTPVISLEHTSWSCLHTFGDHQDSMSSYAASKCACVVMSQIPRWCKCAAGTCLAAWSAGSGHQQALHPVRAPEEFIALLQEQPAAAAKAKWPAGHVVLSADSLEGCCAHIEPPCSLLQPQPPAELCSRHIARIDSECMLACRQWFTVLCRSGCVCRSSLQLWHILQQHSEMQCLHSSHDAAHAQGAADYFQAQCTRD